jgi:hypothetical protein
MKESDRYALCQPRQRGHRPSTDPPKLAGRFHILDGVVGDEALRERRRQHGRVVATPPTGTG